MSLFGVLMRSEVRCLQRTSWLWTEGVEYYRITSMKIPDRDQRLRYVRTLPTYPVHCLRSKNFGYACIGSMIYPQIPTIWHIIYFYSNRSERKSIFWDVIENFAISWIHRRCLECENSDWKWLNKVNWVELGHREEASSSPVHASFFLSSCRHVCSLPPVHVDAVAGLKLCFKWALVTFS